ncbi:MAG: TrkA family potassium uptake protein [Planctomycetota bacterium]
MMKQMVVIGLGQFGAHLARQLTAQHCEVLAVDIDDSRVAELRDEVHRGLIGDARNMKTLEMAIMSTVDEVAVCLGDHMEPSILCTLHLTELGVKRILATAINQDHANILQRVGAHEVIFPDLETAERTARRMANPHLLDYFPFAEEYRIMEIMVPRSLTGKALHDSGMRHAYKLLLLAIKDGGTGEYHFMPDAECVLGDGDLLFLLGREMDLARFSVLK